MEDLTRLIRESMEAKGWSLRDVEAQTKRTGNSVSFSTVSKILKGTYTPGERVLQGLSAALGIPIEKLRKAAGAAEPGTPFKLPDYASRLSPAERSAVEHIVRVMVESKDERKVGNDADSSASNEQAAGSAANGNSSDEDEESLWSGEKAQSDYDLIAFKAPNGERPGDRDM